MGLEGEEEEDENEQTRKGGREVPLFRVWESQPWSKTEHCPPPHPWGRGMGRQQGLISGRGVL